MKYNFDNISKYRITVTDKDGKEYNDFASAVFDTEMEAIAHCEKMNKTYNQWTYKYLKPYTDLTVYWGSLNVWKG